jgi:hypothetical protein
MGAIFVFIRNQLCSSVLSCVACAAFSLNHNTTAFSDLLTYNEYTTWMRVLMLIEVAVGMPQLRCFALLPVRRSSMWL